jgi:hypothetical protein
MPTVRCTVGYAEAVDGSASNLAVVSWSLYGHEELRHRAVNSWTRRVC